MKNKITPKVSFRSDSLRLIKSEDGKRIAEFVISDSTRDRHGTVLDVDGWELKNFNKNGIVGYQHDVYGGGFFSNPDPDSVIGKGKAFVEGKKLIGRVEFEPEEMGNALADKIWKKLEFGTLKTTSVGFLPLEKGEFRDIVVTGSDGENSTERTYHYGKRELLEFSIVNIPSNPSAIKRAFEAASEFNRIPEAEDHEQVRCTLKGENLASFINDKIEEFVTEEKSRESIQEEIMNAARIAKEQFESILAGETLAMVSGDALALALNVESSELIAASEKDGIDYSGNLKNITLGYHYCQFNNPEDYEAFATEIATFKIDEKIADSIFGIKADGSIELHAVRFNMDLFTENELKDWCDDQDHAKFQIGEKKKTKKNSLQFRKKLLALHEQEL